MQLEKERFEAWLFSQPDDRKWNYGDSENCAGCCFVRETTNVKNPNFGGHYWRIGRNEFEIPKWLFNTIVPLPIHFTAAHAKAQWRKLFPETDPQIAHISTLTVNQ